jgi:hypothetical protein
MIGINIECCVLAFEATQCQFFCTKTRFWELKNLPPSGSQIKVCINIPAFISLLCKTFQYTVCGKSNYGLWEEYPRKKEINNYRSAKPEAFYFVLTGFKN